MGSDLRGARRRNFGRCRDLAGTSRRQARSAEARLDLARQRAEMVGALSRAQVALVNPDLASADDDAAWSRVRGSCYILFEDINRMGAALREAAMFVEAVDAGQRLQNLLGAPALREVESRERRARLSTKAPRSLDPGSGGHA